MSEELKTLKDMEDEVTSYSKGLQVYVRVDELKAKAVKDIKAIEKGELDNSARSYIMWKFNLTEEDLKEKK